MSNEVKTANKQDDEKPALIPKLRFPEFQDAVEWIEGTVEEAIVTVTPPKKLPTSEYQLDGKFPIVDQSQNVTAQHVVLRNIVD